MDNKEINETVLKKYLKEMSPFELQPKQAKYPLLDLKNIRPKWYKNELIDFRNRRNQYSIAPFTFTPVYNKSNEIVYNLPYQKK